MPSCDQTGVPIHFHSSTTSGSASLMSLRILLRVAPRQSPSSAILFEISSDADWPWFAPDLFMFFILEVPEILHFARQWRSDQIRKMRETWCFGIRAYQREPHRSGGVEVPIRVERRPLA